VCHRDLLSVTDTSPKAITYDDAHRQARGVGRSLSSGLSPSAQASHLICLTLPWEGARGLATVVAYRRWGLSPRPENGGTIAREDRRGKKKGR